jgi:pyruvate formate-lyase activating enzyme-like uncharacterized protein
MNPKPDSFGAFSVGAKRQACIDCLKGQKMVIFITGVCNKHCFYCPVSEQKMYNDTQMANERPLRHGHELKDLLSEAHAMDATGASITGGDPLTKVDRCVEYIRALKKEFGKQFHIHLYTWGTFATEENVKRLEAAGLDEIRFHLFKDPDFDRVLPALRTKMQVTVEVPCIPTKHNEAELYEMVDYMKAHGIKFLNLNELEFSDANFDRMQDRGFEQANDIEYRTKGSLQLAYRVAQHARPAINVNFCSAANKSFLQVGMRMKRRAKTGKKPFETVNGDGMIEKFVVEGPALTMALAEELVTRFGTQIHYNAAKNRLETTEQNARKIAREFNLAAALITEMPTFDPWDVEKIPLSATIVGKRRH